MSPLVAEDRRNRAAAAALCALATTIAAAWLAIAPEDGARRTRAVLYAAPSGLAADAGRIPARKRLSFAWHGGPLVAASGEQVTVYVSDAYPPEQVSPQVWADFFAGLLHADELRLATIRIRHPRRSPSSAARARSAAMAPTSSLSAAMWSTASLRRRSPGTSTATTLPRTGRSTLARARLGPKRWATTEDVCRRAAAKTAFPADNGDNYRLDPAEAFAEAYRAANETRAGIPFGWGLVDGSFYPDAAALEAIAQDVGAPWSAPTRQMLSRRFTAKGPRRVLVPLALPLDGEVAVNLRVPAGRLDELELVSPDGRTVLARGLWSGRTTRRLSHVACGLRTAAVRVTRKGPPGRFELVLSRP